MVLPALSRPRRRMEYSVGEGGRLAGWKGAKGVVG